MQITVPGIKAFLGNMAKQTGGKNKTGATSAPAEPPAQAQPASQSAQRFPRGLPVIGRLPVARQFQVLLALLGVFLLLAAIIVFVNYRETSQNTAYISTATEMQMLSQRIANSAQQAVQGSPVAFDQLQGGRDQFIANLDLLTKGGNKLGVSVSPSMLTSCQNDRALSCSSA